MAFTSLLSALARQTPRLVPSKGWKVLTGKERPKYFKGKGAAKTGLLTTKGHFRIIPSMLPHYVVPDLTDFPLKPYVANYDPRTEAQPPVAPPGQAKAGNP